ncbi:MAG: HlyD family efflux transporter periplasmic adaptor subunit [Planctomycetes bacterium]|nr:HlyD family efflux transporter periplasmic adaptor subunit [Planctomycetota bacterium]
MQFALIDRVVAVFLVSASAGCARQELEVSGTVEARRVTVSAELQARVERVHAREGAAVEAGDVLIELESAVPKANLAEARARRAEADARVAELVAGSRAEERDQARASLAASQAQLALARLGARAERIAQLEALLTATDARIRLAELSLARAESLLASGPGTQAEVDSVRAELDALRADRARNEAELAEAKLGARPEELQALEAAVAESAARLALVEAGPRAEVIAAARAAAAAAEASETAAAELLARCTLRAPVDGAIEVLDYEPGELAPAGAPLLAIAEARAFRVRSFAPQRVLGDLKPNDRVPVIVDGYPDRPLEARVERIWDEAEFAAGNVQTSDDRMLLVFRVDLELAPSDDPPVRPGTSVVVQFDRRAR